MSTRGNPPSNDRSPVLPLRLLRFKHGEWADVWITHHLTDGRVMGCFTRYLGNGSVFVPSHASGEVKEGKPVIWKGYLSAVQYHRDIKKWVPVVLEVTERLEQDLRGRVARGQLWKISRGPKDGNKRIPLRGVMGQQQRPEMTPVAIDPSCATTFFGIKRSPSTKKIPCLILSWLCHWSCRRQASRPSRQPRRAGSASPISWANATEKPLSAELLTA